ncbi:MAG: hypothetical protein R3Y35_11760 [Clostridia bacterium]
MNKYFKKALITRAVICLVLTVLITLIFKNLILEALICTYIFHRLWWGLMVNRYVYETKADCDANLPPTATASEKLDLYQQELCMINVLTETESKLGITLLFVNLVLFFIYLSFTSIIISVLLILCSLTNIAFGIYAIVKCFTKENDNISSLQKT